MTIRGFRPNIGATSFKGAAAGSLQASLAANVAAQMDVIVENFRALTDNIDSQTGQIVLEALEPTFEMSQELVPVEFGELKASGYLEMSQTKGHATVEMGYGKGGHPDYAIIVHEDLEAYHAPPTQAKYLQQPLEQDSEFIQARIIEGLKIAAGMT